MNTFTATAAITVALAALAHQPATAFESERQAKLVSCFAERGGWTGTYTYKGREYERSFKRPCPQTILADDLGAW